MDAPSTPYSDANADPAVPLDRAIYGYFLCTGFLLADVWFPQAVVESIGQRLDFADAAIGAEAVRRLIGRGWLRASPNHRWLKLTPSSELRASWERQTPENLEHARQIVQQVLLSLAQELRQSSDDETLALVLRQLVHLARLAVAARDAGAAEVLRAIGDGFERLGMHAEARTAYDDAAAALKRKEIHNQTP